MTRRYVIFIDSDGAVYRSPEFNGDKTELERMGSVDRCDKTWREIEREFFLPVRDYRSFRSAVMMAQRLYHSFLCDEHPSLPQRIARVEAVPCADETIYITSGLGITTREFPDQEVTV